MWRPALDRTPAIPRCADTPPSLCLRRDVLSTLAPGWVNHAPVTDPTSIALAYASPASPSLPSAALEWPRATYEAASSGSTPIALSK